MRLLLPAALALFACNALGMSSGVTVDEPSHDWPPQGRVVQIVVATPAGAGPGDAIARLLANELGRKLGSQFVIETHNGINGNIGANIVASARPDGIRLLFAGSGTLAVNPSLYKKPGFDPQSSFDAIGLVAEAPNILVVNNHLPVDSLDDFTEYAQTYPGVVNFGSSGNGSAMHLAGQLYMNQTHTNMVHIPYSAIGLAMTNLISGEIQSMYQLVPDVLAQIKAAQIKPLAVMSSQRLDVLPDVPTMRELGYPELVSSIWYALLAPKGTPPDIIARGNRALNDILHEPDVRRAMADMGVLPLGGTPQDVGILLERELEKWHEVVLDANIYPQ